MRIFKSFFIVVAAVAMFSCEPTYEKEYSWSHPVSGDWFVNAYIDGVLIDGPYEMRAYNTSFGQDSIWIDDYATNGSNGQFWSFKLKAAVNMNTLTFKSDSTINAIPGYGIYIKLTNGKIVNKDSIFFELEFEDDPGTVYQLAGHRETSYDEYMHNF